MSYNEWIKRLEAVPVHGKEGSADVFVIELGGTIGILMMMSHLMKINLFHIIISQICFVLKKSKGH